MSVRIESTVANIADDVAKTGAPGNQRVVVTILDDEEAAELAELRQLIDEGLNSGPAIDGSEVFARLRRELADKYPDTSNAAS